MKFCELLDQYMKQLGCTGKELSDLSGISSSVISRYRNGEREPQINSDTVTALSEALSAIASRKHVEGMSQDSILSSFQNVLLTKSNDYGNFLRKFNLLYDELSLNMKDISAFTNFDTSFLYRIKSGARKTSDLPAFCDKISKYLVYSYSSLESKDKVAYTYWAYLITISLRRRRTILPFTNGYCLAAIIRNIPLQSQQSLQWTYPGF